MQLKIGAGHLALPGRARRFRESGSCFLERHPHGSRKPSSPGNPARTLTAIRQSSPAPGPRGSPGTYSKRPGRHYQTGLGDRQSEEALAYLRGAGWKESMSRLMMPKLDLMKAEWLQPGR